MGMMIRNTSGDCYSTAGHGDGEGGQRVGYGLGFSSNYVSCGEAKGKGGYNI
jgi:hypothetical protein